MSEVTISEITLPECVVTRRCTSEILIPSCESGACTSSDTSTCGTCSNSCTTWCGTCSSCTSSTKVTQKILPWKHISLAEITGWCGDRIYKITGERPEIISDDDSITVTKWRMVEGVFVPDDTNYDHINIETSAWCQDKYVQVNADDAPWYLKDQIESCDERITIEEFQKPDGDWVLRICLAENATDVKVAVKDGCDAEYLEDALVFGDWFNTTTAGCVYSISLKDDLFVKPWARIYLWGDDSITKWAWPAPLLSYQWYFGVWYSVLDAAWSAAFTMGSFSFAGRTTYGITIPKTWFYRVETSWRMWINNSVHSIQYSVWAYPAAAAGNCAQVLDVFYGAPNTVALNNHATSDWASDYAWLMWLPFNWSRIKYFTAWDIIFWWWRMDNNVTAWTNWYVIFESSAWVPTIVPAAGWSASWERCWISVERFGDSNFDERYNY